jgi:predicted ATP-dependent endonuclease of OLD family
MRLIAAEITGFRRFLGSQLLETDGALTAIVGPNEAGKTSILDALDRLDDDDAFELRDLSGRTAQPPDQTVLEALYAVEEADRAQIGDVFGIHDLHRTRLLIIRKRIDGERSYELLDGLERDLGPRKKSAKTLGQLAAAKWLRLAADELRLDEDTEEAEEDSAAEERPLEPFDPDALIALSAVLASDEQVLPPAGIDQLRAVIEQLDGLADERAAKTASTLRATLEYEDADHPNDVAIRSLAERTPHFLPFGNAERDLRSDYDLEPMFVSEEERQSVPVALENIARLAKFDLARFARLVSDDNSAAWIPQLDKANAELKAAFESWSQERVTVRIEKMDGFNIRLHVSDPEGGLTRLDERSDGLKVFVSLVSLTATGSHPVPPIVLVDELERHLHYDAQADLIQVFSRQTTVPQIIYTTHSAGCLPEDLGDGIRMVVPPESSNWSTIVNRFWSVGLGFDPLLVGMGASTLAFVPVRHALMSEGASEVILLPRLLREATGRRSVGYQVAPASSEAPEAHIAGLDRQAVNVAWLVDGDEGGKAIRSHLQAKNIPSKRIFILGGSGSGLVLEDFVASDVYVAAVNEELVRSGVTLNFTEADLTSKNAPRALDDWCVKHSVKVPNKADIANRVLDQKRNTGLVNQKRVKQLRKLDQDLTAFFEPPQN